MEQGGAVCLFLILSKMFQMTTDVFTALKSTFVDFWEKGLSKIQGENVSVITKQLEAVAISLHEVVSLPEEAPLDVLKGLSICSCDDFKATFEFQGMEERIKHILSNNTTREAAVHWIE